MKKLLNQVIKKQAFDSAYHITGRVITIFYTFEKRDPKN